MEHSGSWRSQAGTRDVTTLRGASALATAALLLAAMTACADDGQNPSSNPSPTSTSPTPSVSTPPSDSEVASEAASDVVRRYFATIDQLRQDPGRPARSLTSVGIGTQLTAQQRLLETQRSNGFRQSGDTTIVEVTVQSINLDNSEPTAGRVPTATIDVCWDVSGVDVVDTNGESVVSRDRPDRGWTRFTVSNYRWDSDPTGGWRVAGGKDLKLAPCADS